MSLNVAAVRSVVVRPALRALGAALATEAAEQLVLGTGAVESGYRELVQLGGGPALGLFQMEPATYRDIWTNFLAYRPELARAVRSLSTARGTTEPPPAVEMATNLTLAAAMCRVHYYRAPDGLPAVRDVPAMARLWKSRYNSLLGAGREDDFVRAWQRLVAPIL